MFRYLVLLALVSAAWAVTLKVQPCSGKDEHTGALVEVYCDDITDADNVVLPKGRNYTFGIKFQAGENSPFLEPTIHGIIGGVPVPWLGVNKEACQDLIEGAKCPLVAARTYHYSATIELIPSYPSISLTFQWGLTARDISGVKGKNQVCFRMPARIQ